MATGSVISSVGALSGDAGSVDAGAAYVIFGKTTPFAATLELSALNGSNGVRIGGQGATLRVMP